MAIRPNRGPAPTPILPLSPSRRRGGGRDCPGLDPWVVAGSPSEAQPTQFLIAFLRGLVGTIRSVCPPLPWAKAVA